MAVTVPVALAPLPALPAAGAPVPVLAVLSVPLALAVRSVRQLPAEPDLVR
ncbi:hypothetical protein [Saccharothrix texasensis]|uniref:Uncharacterized protein n=1 Tax=Saccharothrix texasensis TaxID=103734 RepID=A0A3N1H583_9PSEU|nr:hypothetical protein [Saccharothrix texasensis]ROP37648.1 hypothetical protein EDD40_2968 [Saccharothrix texasensis]